MSGSGCLGWETEGYVWGASGPKSGQQRFVLLLLVCVNRRLIAIPKASNVNLRDANMTSNVNLRDANLTSLTEMGMGHLKTIDTEVLAYYALYGRIQTNFKKPLIDLPGPSLQGVRVA
jgi:hypothetical protein